MVSSSVQPCLYCDEPARSREHILASGLGGRLVNDTLICGTHNNRCGSRCDDVLAKQFEFAVHCLDALKGDGNRGTTWRNLKAQGDGAVLSIRPDRTTSLKPIIERDRSSGLPTRIVATERRPLDALQRDLSRLANPPVPTSTEMLREDILNVPLQVGGPGTRGVLKTALHFVAHESPDRAAVRHVAAGLESELFSDSPTQKVRFAPYVVEDRAKGHDLHEVLAWSTQAATLVYVNLFNAMAFLAKLPAVTLPSPRKYTQNTRTGAYEVIDCDAPSLQWGDATEDSTKDLKVEFDERVFRITSVGLNKRYVLAMLDRAKENEPGFASLPPDRQRQILLNAARSFKGLVPMTRWMDEAIIDFAIRRINAEVERPT